MATKEFPSYIKTTVETVTEKNKQKPELQKDFENIENNNKIKNNNIEELKRKIDTITRYQKPYISKMFLWRRFISFSKKYYKNPETYEKILSDIMDNYEKNNPNRNWYYIDK